jgi:hypothetical protein
MLRADAGFASMSSTESNLRYCPSFLNKFRPSNKLSRKSKKDSSSKVLIFQLSTPVTVSLQ